MSNSYEIYWTGVKKELEFLLSPTEIFMWFDRVNYYDFDMSKKVMKLTVPSEFIKDNINKSYLKLIKTTLTNISGYDCDIDIIVTEKPFSQKNEDHSESTEKEKKEEQVVEPKKEIKPEQTNKSTKPEDDNYSFESFIIGTSNEFAAHSAKVVAENPAEQYNPYFIWGESGLGKTHLLKAIQKRVKEKFPSKKVQYVTAEDFTNDFVNSLKSGRPEDFRLKYRSLDVLIIDDVQFFSNKENIQGEFFNTFNKLYNDNKQMVFSCDQPISKVKKLEERLKSRFTMGLTLDLRPPDYELKMAILKFMSEAHNFSIDKDALDYICTNLPGNIRELKGAFKDLLAYSSIMNIKIIDKDIVLDRLKEKITSSMLTSQISVDKIIQIVGEYFDVTTKDLIGNRRTKSLAYARQIAMYISRKQTRLSTTQIGSYFGNKEHGTVMHATKKIDDLIISDPKTKNDVINLMARVKSE